MKVAIFPGTFNPFTIGHADIVERALTIFDKVVIGIGYNPEKGDSNMMWMVYLGTALIIASILMVIFVFVTMGKENAKNKEFYYV